MLDEDSRRSGSQDEGAEMLARHQRGDPQAFEELVRSFGPSVYGHLGRVGIRPPAADDLFQEAFLRVHRSAHRYDPQHAFCTWLFTITSNLIRSHWRKRKVRRVVTSWWRRGDDGAGPVPLDPPDPSPGVEQIAAARQRARRVEAALAELPEGPRQALLLTKVEGLSVAQAAKALGAPQATVKTWVRRGRLALADTLAQLEQGGLR